MSQIRFNLSWFDGWCNGWFVAHILRGERQPERGQAEGQCQPFLERQRLECRQPQSCGCPETDSFSHCFAVRVLFWRPFLQAPSWRPISSSCSDIVEYLSVAISLLSQASCMKYFTVSSLVRALLRRMIFCSGCKYPAVKVCSNVSRKELSIFLPIPNLSVLGKSLCSKSQ